MKTMSFFPPFSSFFLYLSTDREKNIFPPLFFCKPFFITMVHIIAHRPPLNGLTLLPMTTYLEERPLHRVVWIRSCAHDTWRFSTMLPSTILPTECVLMIRQCIEDGHTLYQFDKAFNIGICQSLLCNRLLSEYWFESHFDVLSIGEHEINKQECRPPSLLVHHPSYFVISQAIYGFKMMTLKHHPTAYRYFHSCIFKDPLTQMTDFLPIQSLQIVNTRFMELENPGLLENATYLQLKKEMRLIQKWFQSDTKTSYLGWDPMNHKSYALKGDCWIYPERASVNLPYAHYWKRIQKPCIEWTQILYDMRQFQRQWTPMVARRML